MGLEFVELGNVVANVVANVVGSVVDQEEVEDGIVLDAEKEIVVEVVVLVGIGRA